MGKNNQPSRLKDVLKDVNKKNILESAERERRKSYDIRKIFEQMELDLISSMHKAFYFHKREEAKEGFSWEQWQLSKLRAIEEYRRRNRGIVNSYSKPIQKAIDEQLKGGFKKGENRFIRFSKSLFNKLKRLLRINEEIELEAKIGLPDDIAEKQITRSYLDKIQGKESTPPPDKDFFGINEKKLEALQKVVEQDIKKAQYSVLRKMDDVYRQTIYKAQVYMQSGIKSLDNAIDMATKDFLEKGINSITYKDGKKVNIASYAEMCLRTASQRATFLGEGKKRDEWGIHLVVVSAHANTCEMCMPWQGKILIDDVFSHPSQEYIEENKDKYQFLSQAINTGLLHPNCRHTLINYFPGITQIPEIPDGEDAVKTYEAEQQQRALERQLRKWKRIEIGSQDLKNQQRAMDKVLELNDKISKHLDDNRELRRKPRREQLYGDENKIPMGKHREILQRQEENVKIEEVRNKIKNGEYNLIVKNQKQQEHILGKRKWIDRVKDDLSKGKSPADAFYKDIDIQALINENAGSGIIDFRRNQPYPIEYISTGEKHIGVAFDYVNRKYVKTNRFAIRYSSKGVHAHPVLQREEDLE